ncbi:ABC transporter ATP-binding protein [Nocardia sp. alder85J]|uniref:ABC transporter ATP-binding protein n=1 Tax=Nocardia sp. alder85J TaxID=2862949 RepID=UPI001CD603A5|nr:ABC transporter ATP-binding protein [Nocardia sp. alder85J]MCX4094084.1 ABC transporter ATP-binding protein [Nocardia sp. alder85J]
MGTIEIAGLTRTFKGVTAVDDVTLTIDDGEFLVLLGPSGCGKTTLLRILAGLLEPTAGSITVDGTDITRTPSRRRDLAMVFQSYALYPHLTVAKNLSFPLTARRGGGPRPDRAEIERRVTEVARMLDIAHLLHRRPRELSGGQRQRVAVGRALVRNPRAYLMDEPLSNLDAKLRTATRHELTGLHRSLGATFVYVTHDQVEAMTMATKIVILDHGRIEQVGTPAEVYDRPATRFVAEFIGSPAMNLLDAELTGVAGHVFVNADGISGRLWPGRLDPVAITLGVRPEHLYPVQPTGSADHRGVLIDAVVETVENLGNEEIAYCRTESGAPIALRGTRTGALAEGAPITLAADPDRIHLFDRDTGVRLEWVEDPVPNPAATDLVSA